MGDTPRIVDPDEPTPIYQQLADIFEARIRSGELKPKQAIPAEGRMAEEYGIARMTVRRTVRELRERGLVQVIVGKGTFVLPPEDRKPRGT